VNLSGELRASHELWRLQYSYLVVVVLDRRESRRRTIWLHGQLVCGGARKNFAVMAFYCWGVGFYVYFGKFLDASWTTAGYGMLPRPVINEVWSVHDDEPRSLVPLFGQ
jgi:hypothetical protein